MKKLFFLSLLVLTTPALAQDIACKVVGVSDGDTITCLTSSNSQIKVRLNQIDAPETKQDFGTQSKKSLSDMVFGKQVVVKSTGKDRYGRTLGELYIGNTNINKQQVANGMAWAYREYLTDRDYLVLESSARARKIGIWSEPNPIYPSDFRKQAKNQNNLPAPSRPTITGNQSSGYSCVRKTCKAISTCQEAYHQLNVCGNSSLDRNNDGIPCENICR